MRIRASIATVLFVLAGMTSVPSAQAQCIYQLDDGSAGGGIGPNPDASIAVLNEYTVSGGNSTIYGIEVCWHQGGSSADFPVTVALWSDPNQDGDPSDAVLLGTGVSNSNFAGVCQTIPLSVAVNVGGNGTRFFAGVAWQDGAGGALALEQDLIGGGDAWTIEWPGAPDLNDLSGRDPDGGNWKIRAFCEPLNTKVPASSNGAMTLLVVLLVGAVAVAARKRLLA